MMTTDNANDKPQSVGDAGARLAPAEVAFAQAQRSARLATADANGRPSVVPICYAYDGQRFYTPLDEKPKRASDAALRRVRNIQARPDVALLIDRYDDDWSRLGYLLVHADAALLMPDDTAHADERAHALTLLRARYPQYRAMALEARPLIALTPRRVSAWGPALAESALATPDAPTASATSATSATNVVGANGTGATAGDAPSARQSPWLQPGRGLDFLPLARGRRSVRVFQDRPVPRAALEELLEAARWAPSPHGRQPWRFVVLTGAATKGRLAEAMGDEWRRTLAQDGEDDAIITLRLEKSRERIRTAPALALACLYLEDLDRYPDPDRQRAEEVMAIQSLGAAIQNLLLAAYSVGLDTGWMCAPLFCPDTVRAALGLDATLIPHALLPIGYAARDPQRRAHRPISELATFLD